MIAREAWRRVAAVSCLALAGAALAAPELVYTPPADQEANSRAMEALKPRLAAGSYSFFLGPHELSVAQERRFLGEWDLREDRIVLKFLKGASPPVELRFADMPPARLMRDTVLGAPFYGVPLGPDTAIWCQAGDNDLRLACGTWLAEAFSAFRMRSENIVKYRLAVEQRFLAALEKYPTAASRPPIPESARRYRVQAETAVDARRYIEAAGLYSKALEIAPWWADGYFNVGLLLAEAKDYAGAIRNMRRFLRLEPGHPQARKMQDEIYRWEQLAAKP